MSEKVAASHIMGGEITWECQGGGAYQFSLIVYRDCNGFEINTVSEDLLVWGHPTISDIQVNFISRTDISPLCTSVAGGPAQLDCGSGVGGGNGTGAIEKILYRSDPIMLPGVPPSNGWFFTFDTSFRSGSITNLVNPSSQGITIVASMYPSGGPAGTCNDNSPKFLQEPYLVSCAGSEYRYNPHGVDSDVDSLVFSLSSALDYLNGATFNPPAVPGALVYETGFSATNPTPDATFNAGNTPTTINSETGELSFLSNTIGNFVVKINIDSYRNGTKIASVERELQIIVDNCDIANNPPTITPPFAGGTSFVFEVFAGNPVNFTLNSTDVENLQDGSPQSNIITASGNQFGNNFTDPAVGCDVAPCATLNSTPPISMNNGASVDFSWQTDCGHLVDFLGDAQNSVDYNFVFRVQDDYCPIPKVKYATVTIRVKNQDVIEGPELQCIQTAANDDVTISWDPVTDINGAFAGYEIFSLQNGSLGTVANINTGTFTHVGGGTAANDYYVATLSGCNGATLRTSDTIKNIFLTLNNPVDGTALLSWNAPKDPPLSSFNEYYHIYKEYPAGTWTLIDSAIYGSTFYKDTIDVCSVFLNYQVVLPTDNCDYTSNIEGDIFEDRITPDIPVITNATIDTLTGNVTINWDVNGQADTYGYVIYSHDANGFFVEIDTVWGINNTSYTYNPITDDGSLFYTVAAFDSCYTTQVPPTFQTSAKGEFHRTISLNNSLDICSKKIDLLWSEYVGWDNVMTYEIYGRIIGQPWQLFGSTSQTSFSLGGQDGEDYCFAIRAVRDDGVESFSNLSCVSVASPDGPTFSFISVATVLNETVTVKHVYDPASPLESILLQRYDDLFQDYIDIDERLASGGEVVFNDPNVEVDKFSYRYRTILKDSCGQVGDTSNIAQTIVLNVITDDTELIHHLQWSRYSQFQGGVVGYEIFRGVDGIFDPTPIGTTNGVIRYFVDTVEQFINSTGKICYYVEAIEGGHAFGASERSRSNEVCPVLTPLIYIPNAFSPDGDELNQVWLPITSLHQIENYSLRIYDRYSRLIYETSDPNEGWNGINRKGEQAATGMYIYQLSIRDGNGIEVLKNGHVSLLR